MKNLNCLGFVLLFMLQVAPACAQSELIQEVLQRTNIYGISTEGAEGVLKKFKSPQRATYCEMNIDVYGESGKSNYSFTIRKHQLVEAAISTYLYESPIYVNPDAHAILKRKITLLTHRKEVLKKYFYFRTKFNKSLLDKC